MKKKDTEYFNAGEAMRKKVLGTEFVDQQFSNASEFSEPLQQLVTEFCFGAVWTRSGLSLRDRSLLNIAILGATNNSHALHYHVKAAITNGATIDEIRETLVHLIPYCGFPAAFDAFAIAEKALNELQEENASNTSEL